MGAQRDKCGAGARFGLIFSKTIRLGEESIGHKFVFTRGAPKGGGGCSQAVPPKPEI